MNPVLGDHDKDGKYIKGEIKYRKHVEQDFGTLKFEASRLVKSSSLLVGREELQRRILWFSSVLLLCENESTDGEAVEQFAFLHDI